MAKTIADRLKASRSHMAKVNGENFEDVKNNVKNKNYKNSSNYNQYSNNRHSSGNKRVKSTEPVSVPYNFISLPKQVIPAEFFELDSYTSEELKKLYTQHVLDNGKNSGEWRDLLNWTGRIGDDKSIQDYSDSIIYRWQSY